MAKFQMELPTEVIKEFQKIYDDYDKIVGKMTEAGAEVVYKNVVANVPPGIRNSAMMKNLRITQTYKTPSDGGINTKVGFFGNFVNKAGKEMPAGYVANMFEYGTAERMGPRGRMPKQPFFRKAFKSKEIEKAMLAAQKRESGGLLE